MSETDLPSNVLAYARGERSRVGWRWARWVVVVGLLVLGYFYGRTAWEYACGHYLRWRLYVAQGACVDSSAAVDEIVLRTDGSTEGMAGAAVRASLDPMIVLRRPAAIDAYYARMQQVEPCTLSFSCWGPDPTPRPFPGDGVIACMPVKRGLDELFWVTISDVRTSTGKVGLRAFAHQPTTLSKVASEGNYRIEGKILFYDPAAGPLIVRRVASPAEEAHLRFEQAGKQLLVQISLPADTIEPRIRVQGDPLILAPLRTESKRE